MSSSNFNSNNVFADSFAALHMKAANDPARIVVVDAHSMILLGLKLLLEDEKQLKVVGAAASASDARVLIERHNPQVVVLDLNLRDVDGIAFIKEISSMPNAPHVVLLSDRAPLHVIIAAAQAGARGYINKTSDLETVVTTITLVASGFTCLPERLDTSGFEVLSARESQVIEALLKGGSNRALASQLNLSEKTVSHYKRAALTKLGATSIAALAGRRLPHRFSA